MKRIILAVFMVLCVAQLASAQTGVRIFGAQQFVLDDNTFANPKVYLSANNGSMGIDQNGFVTGTFPNATSMLTILAGTKTFGLKIDGGSTWGLDIVNTNNGIRSAGRNFFGDGAGVDDNVFNIGGGNLIINTLPAPALPGPLSNVMYVNVSNQVQQTPGGVNIVTGSGTVGTVPLWTPTGFQLGNSVITQPTTSTVVVTPAAGGTNVFTINNGSNTSTALKINANGGTGINIDPASTGIQLDATTTGINYVNSNPTTGINLRGTTTGINFANSPTTGMVMQVGADGIQLSGGSNIGINVNNFSTGVAIGGTTAPVTGIILSGTLRGINIGAATVPTTGILLRGGTTGIDFGNTPSSAAINMVSGSLVPSFINVQSNSGITSGVGLFSAGATITRGFQVSATAPAGAIGIGYLAETDNGSITTGVAIRALNAGTILDGVQVRLLGTSSGTSGLNVQHSSSGTLTNGLKIQNDGGGTITTALNISNLGGLVTTGLNVSGAGTAINISGSTTTALATTTGNIIFGSTLNTIASGGTIPNGQAVVDVNNNGVAASVATVTLPVAATNGQVCYITTEDPDGVKITVGLSSVTISNAEVGRFMFINGTWRLEH